MKLLLLCHAYNYAEPASAYKTPQIHVRQIQNTELSNNTKK